MRFASRFFGAVLVTTLGAIMGPVYAQQSAQEAELVALGDAWIEAEVRNDSEALRRFLDERFMATFASGQTIDRSAFIEWVRKAEIKPFTVINESVLLHGDTAVVIGVNSERTVKFTWVAVRK